VARPKKDGRRATGIQAKKGRLFAVTTRRVVKEGVKKYERVWTALGLEDTPQNIQKAREARERLLNDSGQEDVDRNVLLSDYVDRFLERKKRRVSNTTYSAYFYRGRRIKESFEGMKLRNIGVRDVEAFLDELFERDGAQPRTVKDVRVLFGSIMEQAVRSGIIAYNPVREADINKTLAAQHARERKTDDEFFSYEEAQSFLEKARDHALYELFYLTLFFGLRREEVLGLRWSAVDVRNGTMKINHTVTKGLTVMRANTTKTAASERQYPLTKEQMEMFARLRKREEGYRRLFGKGYQDNDYVFKHEDGSLYHPDYPTKAFGKLIKRCPELPQDITFHGLRSSCVSILVHQGMDVKSIQKWVGHADVDTTLRIYAKVKDKESKKEVSDAMNGIITLKDYK
jgi:integrase